MPSLDDLKKRIKSVKSTQKITKAMKMVAAAKLRKAQESAEKGRPYSQKMQNIILNLTKSISDPQNAPKLLIGTGQDKIHLCVVLTADRGLCGGFNSNICKLAKNYFEKVLADNKKLKVVFQPYVEQELQKQVGYNFVNNTSARLDDQGYKTQVNPRDINLFYLMPQLGNRVRIEKTKPGFKLADNSREFTENEILEDLKKYPERYSPNVILRPIYQEVVLPNLSYTGGAGELSYWFQLKDMFTDFEVTFPILMLRNSAIIFSKNNKKRLNKLGLNYSDLFLEISKLEKLLLKKHGTNQIDLNEGKDSLKSLFIKIKELAVTVNPSLAITSDATTTKALKLISKLEKKLERHEKVNLQTVLDQLYLVLEEVFPNGSFQERRTNFSEYYLEDGKEFFKQAYDKFEPLEFEISILNR